MWIYGDFVIQREFFHVTINKIFCKENFTQYKICRTALITQQTSLEDIYVAGCSQTVRCEEVKKVKVRGVLDIHKQFSFFTLTTQIAVFQQSAKGQSNFVSAIAM